MSNVDADFVNISSRLEFKGNKAIITHVSDTDYSAAKAKWMRENSDNGFTKTRNLRLIGVIDAIDYIKYPFLLEDDKATRKFLKMNKEFKACTGNI